MQVLSNTISHLILPGYSNNQKAKLLHTESILALIILLFFGQILINHFPYLGANVLGYASQISTDEIVRLTNEKRSNDGDVQVAYSPLLSAAAKAKGEDMLAKGYWAHVAPDGTQPWKFFSNVGYKYKYAGENLAKDFPSAQAAVDAWMASPSHKDNLLSTKYDEIGVAVVEGNLNGVDTTIIVQLFGKRYDTSIASATTDASAKTISEDANQTLTIKTTPVPSPTPLITANQITGSDISNNSEKTSGSPTPFQILISPFSTKKGFSFTSTSILLITFTVDAVFLARRKVARVGGRTVAHVLFLSMVLIAIILIQSGDLLPPIGDTIK